MHLPTHTHTHTRTHRYKNIPLLPELREMIDWVFTDTVLNLFQWITVQKVWFLIYQIKNRREQEKV